MEVVNDAFNNTIAILSINRKKYHADKLDLRTSSISEGGLVTQYFFCVNFLCEIWLIFMIKVTPFQARFWLCYREVAQ